MKNKILKKIVQIVRKTGVKLRIFCNFRTGMAGFPQKFKKQKLIAKKKWIETITVSAKIQKPIYAIIAYEIKMQNLNPTN